MPAAVWIMPPRDLCLGLVTTALGVLAIYKHKTNIQRLRAGTENRLGSKAKEAKVRQRQSKQGKQQGHKSKVKASNYTK